MKKLLTTLLLSFVLCGYAQEQKLNPPSSTSPSKSEVLAKKALQQVGSPIKGVVHTKKMPESLALLEKTKAFSMDVNNPYLAKDNVDIASFTFRSKTAEQTSPSLNNPFMSELYWNGVIGNQNFKELLNFVEANKAELKAEYKSPYVLIDLFGSTEVDSKRRIAMTIHNIRPLDISDEALASLTSVSSFTKGCNIMHFSFFEYEGIIMYKLNIAIKIKD